MPRWNKKATKIVYDLIGKPDNMDDQETPKERKIKKQLLYEEGSWTK